MELFFLTGNFQKGSETILSPTESRHLQKVLRKRPGDHIDLTDGRGHHLKAKILGNNSSQIGIQIREIRKIPFPRENRIRVALSVIRPKRMDWAVEKLTELGVAEITPLICRYTVNRVAKIDHLQRVTISAMKQSRQFYLPEISQPVLFNEWLEKLPERSGKKFLATLNQNEPDMPQLPEKDQKDVQVAIGPEGGFHQEEIIKALSQNFFPLNLGNTILRTETAAVTAVVRLKMLLESDNERIPS